MYNCFAFTAADHISPLGEIPRPVQPLSQAFNGVWVRPQTGDNPGCIGRPEGQTESGPVEGSTYSILDSRSFAASTTSSASDGYVAHGVRDENTQTHQARSAR
jgi:hypothetical protein